MGAPYFDYVLADKTLIPKEMKKHYVEKILYVPHYQVNDDQRTVIDIKVTKQELGLPQDKFVFCCLNNTFKITPLIFACWMRILKQVPHSVLLLYADRDSAILNLKKQALMHGVEPGRLFFAKHAPFYEYMLRLSVSDLFLDTLPYNAGTTASDAVWVGLPILTCAGKSFASRMAASVLSSLDLPELMTSSLPAYEERAIFLATHPEQLQKIKARLEKNRITSPLFKTKEFVRHLEVAYSLAHDRYQKGLAPEDIEVS
jgi:predicted O-linked N-acetylglucosamine transferase (SPINDLY family)